MIRIYLDWSVISNLKTPEYSHILNFITSHKLYLQFPYSPAHFADLMKSYSETNTLFKDDLAMLNGIASTHLMRWEENQTRPKFATPVEYFEAIKGEAPIDFSELINMERLVEQMDEFGVEFGIGKVGGILKSLFQFQPLSIDKNQQNQEYFSKMFPNFSAMTTQWDLIKEMGPLMKNVLQNREFYKDLRGQVKNAFDISERAGNWSTEEVIDNIDKHLQKYGSQSSFIEQINLGFKSRNKPASIFEFFTSAYFMLDMLGYKADKLPKKTDTALNIQTDSEHAFYGAYCDYFISADKKLRKKAKVLYNEFNIPTEVLAPEEFISIIDVKIHRINDLSVEKIINEALQYIDLKNTVEKVEASDLGPAVYGIKLPIYYLNFFNYVTWQYYEKEQILILSFRKVFKNYSRFIWYTESEYILSYIINLLGYNQSDLKDKIREFIYEDGSVDFTWDYGHCIIRLTKEEDTKRPSLIYAFKVGHNQSSQET